MIREGNLEMIMILIVSRKTIGLIRNKPLHHNLSEASMDTNHLQEMRTVQSEYSLSQLYMDENLTIPLINLICQL